MADTNDKEETPKEVSYLFGINVSNMYRQLHIKAMEAVGKSGYNILNSALEGQGEKAKFLGPGQHILLASPIDKAPVDKEACLQALQQYVAVFSGPDVAAKVTKDTIFLMTEPLEDKEAATNDKSDTDVAKDDNDSRQEAIKQLKDEKKEKDKDKAKESLDCRAFSLASMLIEAAEDKKDKELDPDQKAAADNNEKITGYFIPFGIKIGEEKGSKFGDALNRLKKSALDIGIEISDWGGQLANFTVGDVVDGMSSRIDPSALVTGVQTHLKKKFSKLQMTPDVFDTKTVISMLKKRLPQTLRPVLAKVDNALCIKVNKNQPGYEKVSLKTIADVVSAAMKDAAAGIRGKFKSISSKDVYLVNNYNADGESDRNANDKKEEAASVKEATKIINSIIRLLTEDLSFDYINEATANERNKANAELKALIKANPELVDKILNSDVDLNPDKSERVDKQGKSTGEVYTTKGLKATFKAHFKDHTDKLIQLPYFATKNIIKLGNDLLKDGDAEGNDTKRISEILDKLFKDVDGKPAVDVYKEASKRAEKNYNKLAEDTLELNKGLLTAFRDRNKDDFVEKWKKIPSKDAQKIREKLQDLSEVVESSIGASTDDIRKLVEELNAQASSDAKVGKLKQIIDNSTGTEIEKTLDKALDLGDDEISDAFRGVYEAALKDQKTAIDAFMKPIKVLSKDERKQLKSKLEELKKIIDESEIDETTIKELEKDLNDACKYRKSVLRYKNHKEKDKDYQTKMKILRHKSVAKLKLEDKFNSILNVKDEKDGAPLIQSFIKDFKTIIDAKVAGDIKTNIHELVQEVLKFTGDHDEETDKNVDPETKKKANAIISYIKNNEILKEPFLTSIHGSKNFVKDDGTGFDDKEVDKYLHSLYSKSDRDLDKLLDDLKNAVDSQKNKLRAECGKMVKAGKIAEKDIENKSAKELYDIIHGNNAKNSAAIDKKKTQYDIYIIPMDNLKERADKK